MILKGNLVYTKQLGELTIQENGYLVLDNDGTIQGVFETLPEQYTGQTICDYGQKLILQSFADMHIHAPQYAMLGMGMDLPLLDWLNTYTFRTEAQFTDLAYARRVYRQLARELIANGTTRVAMFSSLSTDATWVLMEELEAAGVTGFVGKVNMDRNGAPYYQETTEESIRETLRWLDGCKDFTYVKPILTPRFTPTCTDELMAWLGKQAQERGILVQSHMSENLAEGDWVRALHPDCEQYWQSYEKFGLWTDRTLMAHCVHSDARERKAMKDHNVVVAHSPDSNINLCSGIAPVRAMLDEGIWVTLGSDVSGGAMLAMPKVITSAIRSSKMKRIESGWSTDFLTVAEGYYLGTTSGHRYFGSGDGFCVGDKLHAVVVDDSGFPPTRPLSVAERFERALYLMDDRQVQAVYSEGRKVK